MKAGRRGLSRAWRPKNKEEEDRRKGGRGKEKKAIKPCMEMCRERRGIEGRKNDSLVWSAGGSLLFTLRSNSLFESRKLSWILWLLEAKPVSNTFFPISCVVSQDGGERRGKLTRFRGRGKKRERKRYQFSRRRKSQGKLHWGERGNRKKIKF